MTCLSITNVDFYQDEDQYIVLVVIVTALFQLLCPKSLVKLPKIQTLFHFHQRHILNIIYSVLEAVYFYFMFMGVCLNVCFATHACSASGDLKRVLDPVGVPETCEPHVGAARAASACNL